MTHLTFSTLTEADIPALTRIMKRAFDDDSRRHFANPVGGPPGYDDGSFLHRWGIEANSYAYRVDLSGEPVGCVIVFNDDGSETGYLGTIFVDPDFMGKGIGYAIWRFVEDSFPNVKSWYLETPAVSYRNHCFYINKCGFQVYAVSGEADRYEAQFKLKKLRG